MSAIKGAVNASKQATKGLGGGIPSVSIPTSGGGGSQSTSSAPPQFNIVGQSIQSQLAQTIAGQTSKPVQAFVVSNDVTTAQSLERNTIKGASL